MGRLALGALLAAALAGAASLPDEAPSSSAIAAASVFDRTVVCATQPLGGIRQVLARGSEGVREFGSRTRWFKLPFARFSTGRVASVTEVFQDSFVWATAGRPLPTTTIVENWYQVHPHEIGTFGLSTRSCRARSGRIPLSRAGLQGGSPGQLGSSYNCVSPRRVLLRVRAVFASDPKTRTRDGFLRSTVPLVEAKVALRTEAGKPLAYAEVAQSGRARLFTTRACEAS